MSSLVLVSGPSTEPVTLEEVKSFLRLTGEVEDSLLTLLQKSAREYVEIFTGRQLFTATYDYKLDCFPSRIDTPKSPLQSITHIKYYDLNGVEQTLSTDYYDVDTSSEPGRIVEAVNYSWPEVYEMPSPITIRMILGCATVALIPSALRHAILLLVSHYYENREIIQIGTIVSAPIPIGIYSLLYNNKVIQFK